MNAPMPVAFLGHGSPMNAIETNRYTEAWKAFAAALPRPRAIVAISAHWDVPGSGVTVNERPPTIHDFGGFPPALFAVTYPAPGDPGLAAEIAALLGLGREGATERWGLDHGTWSLLVHMYPKADIPVLQVAVDTTRDPAYHWELGARLGALRDRGVLIIGSGNVVHNLQTMNLNAPRPYDWNVRFDIGIANAVADGDRERLLGYQRDPDAAMAAPDAEHFVPVIAIAGLRRPADSYRSIVEGYELGSMSMRAFALG
jgi:4,5-DOPA dioxygenase extradiol